MRITLEKINGEDFQKIVERTNSPENIYDHHGSLFPKIQVLEITSILTEDKARHFYCNVSLAVHTSHMPKKEYLDFMEFLYNTGRVRN